MMNDMSGMMSPLMGMMMTYWAIVSVLVLVVLALLSVWLIQQVRGGGTEAPRP